MFVFWNLQTLFCIKKNGIRFFSLNLSGYLVYGIIFRSVNPGHVDTIFVQKSHGQINQLRFNKGGGGCQHWPHGRGIFISADEKFLVWLNEEDHLRIISMDKGGDLNAIYKRYFLFII